MGLFKKAKWMINNYSLKKSPPFVLKIPYKPFDIEITSDCNTTCVFCPRDKIKQKGYITSKNFIKAVERFKETNHYSVISLCGLGEPLLHPNLIDFVKYLSDQNLNFNLTTNGKLLTDEMSYKLIEAGLKEIHFSASGVGETYEKIHRLKFDLIEKNIDRFLKIADGKCNTQLSLISCKENENQLDHISTFWKKKGIDMVLRFGQCSRGGALDMNYYFMKSNRFYDEAQSILSEHQLIPICIVPMLFGFLGWDGQYYLCCHDYSKKHPLGDVNEFSVEDIIKLIQERSPFSLCKRCEFDPVNIIREILFQIEAGEMKEADLINKIANMAKC